MISIKDDFIRLALSCNVLKFGKFTLKSGRISPYFFNMGLFYHGSALNDLGNFYANLWVKNNLGTQQIFGPAYKGLPLATATAIALNNSGIDTTVTFNRKETKDHGEGGILIGAPLTGNTVVIDDVITAGTAFREAQKLITEQGGKVTTLLIALNRCERGIEQYSSIQEIQNQGINVYSIIDLFDLIDFLQRNDQQEQANYLLQYYKLYGCQE
jgi:orotate phosphoribosyltransferase